jgi:hypothetical protein
MMGTVSEPPVPVERRTYFPIPRPAAADARLCPACGQRRLIPWYLRRDRARRVWRRWVCLACQAHEDRLEEESA